MRISKPDCSLSQYFVGSLPGVVEENELSDYFSNFGVVESLQLVKNKKTSVCKGFGFVSLTLKIEPEIFRSIKHKFMGREIFIRPHLKGEELEKQTSDFTSKRLFINNVPSWMSEQDLCNYFSRFGTVELSYISPNFSPKKKPAGLIGFINFGNKESVASVLKQPKHSILGHAVKCAQFKAKRVRGDGNGKSDEREQNKEKGKRGWDGEEARAEEEQGHEFRNNRRIYHRKYDHDANNIRFNILPFPSSHSSIRSLPRVDM